MSRNCYHLERQRQHSPLISYTWPGKVTANIGVEIMNENAVKKTDLELEYGELLVERSKALLFYYQQIALKNQRNFESPEMLKLLYASEIICDLEVSVSRAKTVLSIASGFGKLPSCLKIVTSSWVSSYLRVKKSKKILEQGIC